MVLLKNTQLSIFCSITPTSVQITLAGRIHDSMHSDEVVSMDLLISEAHVGGLIGKQGSNISKIRNESGATIKVGDFHNSRC